ncbi:MAG: hypothetical protein Q8R25_04000 [bacterium]|nr:hypothetical protein [bacterium]
MKKALKLMVALVLTIACMYLVFYGWDRLDAISSYSHTQLSEEELNIAYGASAWIMAIGITGLLFIGKFLFFGKLFTKIEK